MSETESSGARGWPRSTAIIGAGTMGLGVAESFAVAGTAVRLTDVTPESTRRRTSDSCSAPGGTRRRACWGRRR
jgi:3-hydroxyisobutyrate dehydrogenase-like beta-hydroxyacid dehydrogenase